MRKNKKAQQSIGMSFGMMFSIFLIIVFLAAAIYGIIFFLSLGDAINVGQFYETLQREVDSAWTSSITEKNITLKLAGDITDICFVDHAARITNQVKYQQLLYVDVSSNLFLLPSEAAGDLDIRNIEHINITKITERQNPVCFRPGEKITIKKDLYSKLVEIYS